MTTALTAALPVTTWDADEYEWLADRRRGLGASGVSTILGFNRYSTPWQVWAEKTGARIPGDEKFPAAELGHNLEPWLIDQATRLLDVPVTRTEYRMYAHPEHPWRLCSPDGITATGDLVEAKTGGIASGFGPVNGWDDDRVPLDYEFQARWAMHVMNAPAVQFVALIAGRGLITRTVTRDLATEVEMVKQASDWWHRHVVEGVEPPFGHADTTVIADLYPRATVETVDLDGTDAVELWTAYRRHREDETAAKQAKETAGAALKALLGNAAVGFVDGHVIATWGEKRGRVNWQRLAESLAQQSGLDLPDPELFRDRASRSLTVKD